MSNVESRVRKIVAEQLGVKEEELRKFDRFRQLRNDSVYKAKTVTNEDSKASVLFAIEFINKANSLLKSKK